MNLCKFKQRGLVAHGKKKFFDENFWQVFFLLVAII